MALVACLGPQPQTASPVAGGPSESPGAPEREKPPSPWVFKLDREGLVLDGARVGVKDEGAFRRAWHRHWRQDPILEVAPDAPSISVAWVVNSARLVKLSVLDMRSGSFARQFWTTYSRDDNVHPLFTLHVVGGDLARFQRFEVATSATTPGSFERFDWRLGDERSTEDLRAWLAKRGRSRDLLELVTPENLPFGEVTPVLSRLNEVWSIGPSMRVFLAPATIGLDAPIEEKFAAGSIPIPVVYATMKFVDASLGECHAHSSDKDVFVKIIFRLNVDASGNVNASLDKRTTMKDSAGLECMLTQVRKARFPKREGVPPTEAIAGFFFRAQ
jgi:hypothetical protein